MTSPAQITVLLHDDDKIVDNNITDLDEHTNEFEK